jgi:hypothetical protein
MARLSSRRRRSGGRRDRRSRRFGPRAGLGVGFPLSYLGVVSGFLTGSSRSPAVSALVPAVLTFIGLVVVYMIGKGPLRAVIAGFAVFVLTINVIFGAVIGAASRDRHEEELASAKVRELKADQEFKLRMYCRGLGLITDLSKPCPVDVKPTAEDKPDKP